MFVVTRFLEQAYRFNNTHTHHPGRATDDSATNDSEHRWRARGMTAGMGSGVSAELGAGSWGAAGLMLCELGLTI
jgi:hypothetical protein